MLQAHTNPPKNRSRPRVAYLVNQYPMASHSFIRREILALERQGLEILRVASRGWEGGLQDPQDQQERSRTSYLMRAGTLALIWASLHALTTRPVRFLAALALAVRMSVRSERPLPYHVIYLAQACRLTRWAKSFGASHIHAHFGTNSAEVAMLAHVLGAPPYSFTAHGSETVDNARFIGLGEKIRRAAFVVAVCSFGRSQLFRWVDHAHWSKVHVVHCGLEREFYDLAPTAAPALGRLVCVARLTPGKGQLLLLDAARILARRAIDFELVLAGDGEGRAEVERLIARHGLEDRVRITGWISSARVRQELLGARALVLPSFSEGLPVVIMEAMALRRPVLTTWVGGIPELVRDGENGWLFPAGSVEALAEAMENCLSCTPQHLEKMGDAARALAVERHSVDVAAAKLAELFRNSAA